MSWEDMNDKVRVEKLAKELEGLVFDPDTEEGQDAIYNDDKTHTGMIWEDGEITFTKNGDLWMSRRLHQRQPPLFDHDLWEVPEDEDHRYKVIPEENKDEVHRLVSKAATEPIPRLD